MFTLLAQSEPHLSPLAAIVILVLAILFLGYPLFRIAKKTRTTGAIMAFIPFVNLLLMISVAEVSILWVVGLFIPVVNIVAIAVIWMGICKRCNKEPLLGLAIFVPVLGLILPWYLAFSD